MDVDAARQKLRAHDSHESPGRNGVGERVRFEQQHHHQQRRRLADQISNSVDLTGDLSSDEGSSAAATRSGLARSQGNSQRSSPSLFARAAAPPSSSSSVRIQAKTTYSSTNRSNIMSSRFPGQGFPLSSGSSSGSQPKGVPFRPQDPEAKRALAGFSQPGRNFVNGSSAGKPYQGGGWDRGFNSERADTHDSRSSSSKQKPARLYPSLQQFSEPSFKKVTTFEQPHHHPRSTSRVSGMTVKGAGLKGKEKAAHVSFLDVDGDDDDDDLEVSVSAPGLSDMEERGRAGASKAREKVRAPRSLFGSALRSTQTQDDQKSKPKSRTSDKSHCQEIDDDIQDPDASQPSLRSSKRPRHSSDGDPLDTLTERSRGKVPRASKSASAIAQDYCAPEKRRRDSVTQGTLDNWHSLDGTSGTDDFGKRKGLSPIIECRIGMVCHGPTRLIGNPEAGHPLRLVLNTGGNVSQHTATIYPTDDRSGIELKMKKDFNGIRIPEARVGWLALSLTHQGEAKMRGARPHFDLEPGESSLAGQLPSSELFIAFEHARDCDAIIEHASSKWCGDSFKRSSVGGVGGRLWLENYQISLSQVLSGLDEPAPKRRASTSSIPVKRSAPRTYGSTSTGSRQSTLMGMPSFNTKTRKRESEPSARIEESEDDVDITSTRRSFRKRRETKRTATPEEVDPIPADTLILVWPPEGGPGSVYLHHGDRKRLADGEFLNDTLIDYGLKRILSATKDRDEQIVDRIHLFNSFFYKKLSAPKSRKEPKLDAYSTVRKWTQKIKLFEKDVIIVPINENLHWYLALIVNPKAVLQTPKPPPPPKDVPARNTRKTARESAPSTPVGETKSHYFPLVESKEGVDASTTAEVAANGSNEPDEVILSSTAEDAATQERDAERLSTSSAASEEVSRQLVPPDEHVVPDSDSEAEAGAAVAEAEEVSKQVAPEEIDLSAIEDAMSLDGQLDDGEVEIVPEEKRDKCYILTFDSLGGAHTAVHKKLKAYLVSEALDKLQMSADQVSIDDAVGVAVDVPVQENYSDCGLYLLHFVDTFLSDPNTFLQSALTPKQKGEKDAERRARIAQVWSDDVARKRRRVMREDVNLLSAAWLEQKEKQDKEKQDSTGGGGGAPEKPKKKRPRVSAPANMESASLNKDSDSPSVVSAVAAALNGTAKRGRAKKTTTVLPQSITIEDSEDEYTTDDAEDSDELPELAKRSSQPSTSAVVPPAAAPEASADDGEDDTPPPEDRALQQPVIELRTRSKSSPIRHGRNDDTLDEDSEGPDQSAVLMIDD